MAPADQPSSTRVLTINCGSSSLKAAVFELEAGERRVLNVTAVHIGLAGSRLRVRDGACSTVEEDARPLEDYGSGNA
jgi:acetate kinase